MDDGKVNIHGKEYKTVALRIDEFRHENPMWTIQTELIESPGPIVVMKASILDEKGRIISTGHAEENRQSSQINKTSALENCETSAIGRALAFFGLAGSEIASADEVANAIESQKKRPPKWMIDKLNEAIEYYKEKGKGDKVSNIAKIISEQDYDKCLSAVNYYKKVKSENA